MIRFLLDQSKKDPEKYRAFFDDFGLFMREGIVTTQEQDVKVAPSFVFLFCLVMSKRRTAHLCVSRAVAAAGRHRQAAEVRVVGAAGGPADQPDGVRVAHEGGHAQHPLPVRPQPPPGRALALLRGHEAEGHGGEKS